jgi:hypothetical protein
MNMVTPETAKAATELPEWPKHLAEQAQAVQRTLQQFTHPVSPVDINRQFAPGKKAANTLREELIGHLLETICTLGLLRKTEAGLFVR